MSSTPPAPSHAAHDHTHETHGAGEHGPDHGDGLRGARAPGRVRALLAGTVLIAGLAIIRVVAPATGGVELADLVQDFVTLSVAIVIESFPFVILGIAISVLVQIWVPRRILLRLLPTHPIPRRFVMSVLGILLPVCECGNVPLSRGLIVRGVSVPEAMTFLVAAPIVNPVTIITTYQAFGFDDGILLGRIVGGLAIANLVGWLFSKHPDPQSLLTRRFAATCTVAHAERDEAPGRSRARRSAALFAEESTDLLPALLIGAAIAGVIQVAVSRDILIALGANPVWSVLALMLLGFVVALCSTVDAFFILAFASTFSPGAIVAFLVFGPIIDIRMLALLRTTFTARALLLLTAVVALATMALGFGMNLV